MSIRYNMRDFVNNHSQLQHVNGITYRVGYDKAHSYRIEISLSRDTMRNAGWKIGDLVDLEWDECRIYLVRKPEGMYKLRFSHTSYKCHPQKHIPGRFVGCIKCAWKPELKLPKINPKVHCDDVHIGNKIVSFAMPK